MSGLPHDRNGAMIEGAELIALVAQAREWRAARTTTASAPITETSTPPRQRRVARIDLNDRRPICALCGVVLYVNGGDYSGVCIFCAGPTYEQWRAERVRRLSE